MRHIIQNRTLMVCDERYGMPMVSYTEYIKRYPTERAASYDEFFHRGIGLQRSVKKIVFFVSHGDFPFEEFTDLLVLYNEISDTVPGFEEVIMCVMTEGGSLYQIPKKELSFWRSRITLKRREPGLYLDETGVPDKRKFWLDYIQPVTKHDELYRTRSGSFSLIISHGDERIFTDIKDKTPVRGLPDVIKRGFGRKFLLGLCGIWVGYFKDSVNKKTYILLPYCHFSL